MRSIATLLRSGSIAAKTTHSSLMSTSGAIFRLSSSASVPTQQDQKVWSYKGMSEEKVVDQIDFINKVLRDMVVKVAELDSDKLTLLKNGENPINKPLITEIDEQMKKKKKFQKKFQKKYETELRELQEAIERSTTATTPTGNVSFIKTKLIISTIIYMYI